MEFEHVGLRCYSCNSQDFLPKQCSLCLHPFCAQCMPDTHLHSCERRDMTSFDCPLCHQSVRHARGENVDDVWSAHFTSSPYCQQASQASSTSVKSSSSYPRKTCAVSECRVKLGPSNRFTCKKCSSDVCLSHRMPEAHLCSSIPSNRLSKLKPCSNTTVKVC